MRQDFAEKHEVYQSTDDDTQLYASAVDWRLTMINRFMLNIGKTADKLAETRIPEHFDSQGDMQDGCASLALQSKALYNLSTGHGPVAPFVKRHTSKAKAYGNVWVLDYGFVDLALESTLAVPRNLIVACSLFANGVGEIFVGEDF